MLRKLTSVPLNCCMPHPLVVVLLGDCTCRGAKRSRGAMTGGMSYRKGLHELGEGCFAYLQPDGGWGWSNAGLLVGDGASLLVDTLFDLRLTAEMLESMSS